MFSQDRDLLQIPISFFRNLVFFSFDILTHPVVIVLFAVGSTLSLSEKWILSAKPFKQFASLGLMYFLLTVFGSSFAYPAWHQSFGLVPIFGLFSLQIGFKLRHRLPHISGRSFLVAVFFILCPLLIRVALSVDARANAWDGNLLIRNDSGSTSEMSSAEIIYSPFKLGIEDVINWKWMADSYFEWKSQLRGS
jgi:hypothetical protein